MADTQLGIVWRALLQRATRKYPSLHSLKLRHCREAEDEHAYSSRQYMHVGHVAHSVCFAQAAEDLPLGYQAGILAHEIGHEIGFLLGDYTHTENQANTLGGEATGLKIVWRSNRKLEYAEPPGWLEEAVSE